MNIKEIRKKLNLNQLEMANLLGVKQSTISRYEDKKLSFTLAKLDKYFYIIADYCLKHNLDPEYILDNQEKKTVIIPTDNEQYLKEEIMKFFNLKEKDFFVEKISSKRANGILEANTYAIVNILMKDIDTGFFLIKINSNEAFYKVIYKTAKYILTNEFAEIEYDKKLHKIIGRVVGNVSFKEL